MSKPSEKAMRHELPDGYYIEATDLGSMLGPSVQFFDANGGCFSEGEMADVEAFLTSMNTPTTEAIAEHQRVLEMAEKALDWYGHNSQKCRLIHSGGDAGRHALSSDGGHKARAVLAEIAKLKKE